MSIEAQIAKLLQQTADAIVAIVQEDVREKIAAALQNVPSHGIRRFGPKKGIRPCKVPGCGNPSKGPRFGFLCAEHRAMPKSKIAALLARKAK